MAHDGIDSVPQTGTWLLQKGERVTTASTSAKLDATLDRVASNTTTTTSGGDNYSANVTVYGDPDKSTISAIRREVEAGMRKQAGQLSSGTGEISRAMGNWTTKRRVS